MTNKKQKVLESIKEWEKSFIKAISKNDENHKKKFDKILTDVNTVVLSYDTIKLILSDKQFNESEKIEKIKKIINNTKIDKIIKEYS